MNQPYTTTTTSDAAPTPRENPMDRPLLAVPVIIAINVLIFAAWQFARTDQALMSVMNNNFVVSSKALAEGRFWTLLTAAFSHYLLWHIAINMLVLWSFGSFLEKLWGVPRFVAFYLVTAVVASYCHCLVSVYLLNIPDDRAVGASGAVAGLLLAFALMFPRFKILFFGVIPVPALVGAIAFVGVDLWGLFAQTAGGGIGIGHGAHLGGALCGFLYWLFYLRTHPQPLPGTRSLRMEMSLEEVTEFQRLRTKLDREGPGALTPKEKVFLETIKERVMRAHESQ